MNPGPAISGGSQRSARSTAVDDLGGNVPRRPPQLLAQRHGEVGLVVAEPRVLGRRIISSNSSADSASEATAGRNRSRNVVSMFMVHVRTQVWRKGPAATQCGTSLAAACPTADTGKPETHPRPRGTSHGTRSWDTNDPGRATRRPVQPWLSRRYSGRTDRGYGPGGNGRLAKPGITRGAAAPTG